MYLQFATLIGIFISHAIQVTAQDFLGCGGFVKSDVEISFSRVEVKLYTKQGSLKYQTDCAPNNGYFLIPIYDKGDFILKVEPPIGWTFDPSTVELSIDGKSDPCSKGEDINFKFNGFSINGRVISKGMSEGPAGVRISLKKKPSMDVLQEILTDIGGKYVFSKVMPGDYIVTASHPLWKFETSTAKYTVTKENGNLGDQLVVNGYDVNGEVRSEGEAIQGVAFLLFSNNVQKQDIHGCDFTPVKGFTSAEQSKLLCNVESDKNGKFLFPSLPSGHYWLIPFYKGEHITFDVVPDKLNFDVSFESVKLEPIFQVEGFSVTGKVLDRVKGSGLSGVSIKLDGKPQTLSEATGMYRLDKVTSGSYVVEAQIDDVFFDAMTVKITPNTPQLPDITAMSFNLCGKVILDAVPENFPMAAERQVTFNLAGSDHVTTLTAKADGSFCSPVKPGNYVIKVIVKDTEAEAGLKIIPAQHSVTITNKPFKDVIFTQFKAKVTGLIKCLGVCGSLSINVASKDRDGDERSVQISQGTKQASFIINNVLPGKYIATVIQDEWCWKEKTVQFEVVDKDVGGVEFVQSGFVMKCTTSHSMILEYVHTATSKSGGKLTADKGLNQFCLLQSGQYTFTPHSCHQFERDVYTYDTASNEILAFTAVKHLVSGTLVTNERVQDMILTIQSSIETEPPINITPLKSKQEIERDEKVKQSPSAGKDEKNKNKSKESKMADLKGPFTYEYSYYARSAEKLIITPSSAEFLFYPPLHEVTVLSESCPTVVPPFEGRLGVFLVGSIVPALRDVDITITPESPASDVHNILIKTDDTGKYRVGPLHDSLQYGVSANKEGYILTAIDGKHGSFKAFKLGEIIIEVFDEDETPLQGVLLSLSGGNFRSNNLTQDKGLMHFGNLKPGQYFLRPMMKEYKFEPSSQMMEVLEGTTVKLQIKGFRVAFSCYGRIMSLNGEPEPGISIQALGIDNCGEILEETISDHDGTFRMRGLQPQCTYELKVTIGEENGHVARAAPEHRIIKVENQDITDVRIIVFRKFNQFDIGGNIITAVEHLPTLKLLLFSEDNQDSALHTLTLGTNHFFQFPTLPIDGMRYIIKVESSLAKSNFDYTLPTVSFTTEGYQKHVTLKFEPKRRNLDQEIGQGSYITLPLILLAVYVAYNHTKIRPYIQQFAKSIPVVKPTFSKPTIAKEEIEPEETVKYRKKVKTRKT
ncbi:BOS complex subunit NOMO1 [Saccoglossus kowalevskii]|uniref:Nodal modulator 1 n=2 Tax=Saccoglossus kowalevskii TaxID=10224 RepID=A0ABM0M269_SACKO|nr:PREDICTED: nodal modulator 1 [Saccoglossus kowalevskii]